MKYYLTLFFLITIALGQQNPAVFPTQIKAIYSLSESSSISKEGIDNYIQYKYKKSTESLTQKEAAELITALQSGTVKLGQIKNFTEKSNPNPEPKTLELAAILEPGMSKLFHFRDRSCKKRSC